MDILVADNHGSTPKISPKCTQLVEILVLLGACSLSGRICTLPSVMSATTIAIRVRFKNLRITCSCMGRRVRPKKERASQLIDKFSDWLDHMRHASVIYPVLVGHDSEKHELESFDIQNVVVLHKPEDKIIRSLHTLIKKRKLKPTVILMMDVDRRSEKHYHAVKNLIEQHGLKVNGRFRKFLYLTELKELSGLRRYLEKHITLSIRRDVFGLR